MKEEQNYAVRLLPLTPASANEGLANLLARLLTEDESQAEHSAQAALFILSGIQAFLDSGDYRSVEILWEPVLVARQMEKAYGTLGAAKATDMAAAMRLAQDERGAAIYERASELLRAKLNNKVDNGP